MAYQEVLSDILTEGSTAYLDVSFFDEDHLGFMPTTIQATLYDSAGKDLIMNGVTPKRDHQDLLDGSGNGINGAETWIVGSEYGITLFLDAGDTVSVGGATKIQIEPRVLLIEWTWDSGEKRNAMEIVFAIANMLFRPEVV